MAVEVVSPSEEFVAVGTRDSGATVSDHVLNHVFRVAETSLANFTLVLGHFLGNMCFPVLSGHSSARL
jgi:hypothetical protein